MPDKLSDIAFVDLREAKSYIEDLNMMVEGYGYITVNDALSHAGHMWAGPDGDYMGWSDISDFDIYEENCVFKIKMSEPVDICEL